MGLRKARFDIARHRFGHLTESEIKEDLKLTQQLLNDAIAHCRGESIRELQAKMWQLKVCGLDPKKNGK